MHYSKKPYACFFIKDMNINKLTFLVVFFLANYNIGTEGGIIGVNWGRQNAQRLVPSMVVDILLQNNVSNARVYTSHIDILQAFSGSGIHLTIGVYHINTLMTPDLAKKWVRERSNFFASSKIKRVLIGPLSTFTDRITARNNMAALTYTQKALEEAGHKGIDVNFPMPYQLIERIIYKPSEAEFKKAYQEDIISFLNILRANNAPFCLELFPIAIMEFLGIPINTGFALANKKSTHVVWDNNGTTRYTDIFTFTYDAFSWALSKIGFPDIKIVVTQIGWPTDGWEGANVTSAEHFYKYLLPMVASGKGTPMRPNSTIDIFVHALTDENKNQADVPYSRHWGIYRSNGEPKYKIDLSGRGQEIYPTRATGIMRMPNRWCVLDETKINGNERKMRDAHEEACLKSDCTCTLKGGSCSGLSRTQNVSYAFNRLFQDNFQDDRECYYDGLAKIVTNDPSNGTCVFPVEVVKGKQNNFGCGKRYTGMPGFAGIFVILLSTLWTLFYR